jgi:hypothetical protein
MTTSLLKATFCLVLFVLGCVCYELQTRQLPLITVDIQRLVRQTADHLAHEHVSEDRLQLRLQHFKQGLEKSLNEFSRQQKALIVPSHIVYGKANDMTDAFIVFHNGADAATPAVQKEAK